MVLLFPGPAPGEPLFPAIGGQAPGGGNAASPDKALAIEACTIREVHANCRTASHLCDPTRTRAEKRTTQGHPVPRGGFHKAGEGPAFGDSFPHFSSGRNGAQRSVPTGGAGFRLRHWRRTSPPSAYIIYIKGIRRHAAPSRDGVSSYSAGF